MAKTAALQSARSLSCPSQNSPHLPPLPVPALRPFRNGLSRGAITEIVGRRSSGRMTAILHILAQATAQGEICAVVDTTDGFHPASAEAAGVILTRIVWVRCDANAENALRVTDLLLHSGGFGVVALDLCEVKMRVLDRIPISYWYRFRRAIEHTSTILLVCAQSSQAKASTSHLELSVKHIRWAGASPFRLLQGVEAIAQLRKPIDPQPDRLLLQTKV
jgi:recA bacterial DNA recombination protein